MKQKYLYIILIVIFLYSCDDNPSIIVNETEPTSSNITFTPDTLYISDNIQDNIVQFEGIDFITFMPDSVRFDKHKVEIVTADRTNMFVKLPFKYIGKFSVNLFYKSELITLDKSITLINNNTSKPTYENLYFEPDTLNIYTVNSPFLISMRGMNFNNKVDSILIGGKKCLVVGDKSKLGSRLIDSIIVYPQKYTYGVNEVVVYLEGQKIVLPRKLVVINPLLEIDFTKLNKFTWEIRNIKIYEEYSTTSWDYQNGYVTSKTYKTRQYNSVVNVSSENITVGFSPPANFGGRANYYYGDGFSYELDSIKGFIKNFSGGTSKRFIYNRSQDVTELDGFQFANAPYKINFLPNNKIEMEIKLSGYEIDKYSPFVYFTCDVRTSSNKYSTSSKTISKKDQITGKDINYYPATDSSLIVIHLRNF